MLHSYNFYLLLPQDDCQLTSIAKPNIKCLKVFLFSYKNQLNDHLTILASHFQVLNENQLNALFSSLFLAFQFQVQIKRNEEKKNWIFNGTTHKMKTFMWISCSPIPEVIFLVIIINLPSKQFFLKRISMN